ncbi:MAG TPA: DUF2249 domain-containing protein [Candidatus Limnocylindrales bacterium]|nr:DUF2249 domain-containing protein [Candidatus Limnocylindrales bacterium]
MTSEASDAAARDAAVPDAAVAILTTTLVKALRRLGEAGQPAVASRLAATAYVGLRHDQPRSAARLNGVMHHLARLEGSGEPIDRRYGTMTEQPTLDVRSEPPVRRHTLIFETYEALAPGDAFVLVNDHDPKPLYYQFAAEHAGAFSWDYLEQGPEVWRVRIGRTPVGVQAKG